MTFGMWLALFTVVSINTAANVLRLYLENKRWKN